MLFLAHFVLLLFAYSALVDALDEILADVVFLVGVSWGPDNLDGTIWLVFQLPLVNPGAVGIG